MVACLPRQVNHSVAGLVSSTGVVPAMLDLLESKDEDVAGRGDITADDAAMHDENRALCCGLAFHTLAVLLRRQLLTKAHATRSARAAASLCGRSSDIRVVSSACAVLLAVLAPCHVDVDGDDGAGAMASARASQHLRQLSLQACTPGVCVGGSAWAPRTTPAAGAQLSASMARGGGTESAGARSVAVQALHSAPLFAGLRKVLCFQGSAADGSAGGEGAAAMARFMVSRHRVDGPEMGLCRTCMCAVCPRGVSKQASLAVLLRAQCMACWIPLCRCWQQRVMRLALLLVVLPAAMLKLPTWRTKW